MQNNLVLFTLIIFISACSGSDDNYDVKNDFEGVNGWFDCPQIRKGDAHSGKYFIDLNGPDTYSIAYKNKLSEISSKPFTSIRASAWMKFSSLKCKAKIVVSIDSVQGAPAAYWSGINAEDIISEPGKWVKVSGTMNLPANLKPGYIFHFYAWNNGTDPVQVDDISFIIHP